LKINITKKCFYKPRFECKSGEQESFKMIYEGIFSISFLQIIQYSLKCW